VEPRYFRGGIATLGTPLLVFVGPVGDRRRNVDELQRLGNDKAAIANRDLVAGGFMQDIRNRSNEWRGGL